MLLVKSRGGVLCWLLVSDPEVGRDVLQLVQCLRLVSMSVLGDMAYVMEKALEHMHSPERAAEQVLDSLLANDRSVQPSCVIIIIKLLAVVQTYQGTIPPGEIQG